MYLMTFVKKNVILHIKQFLLLVLTYISFTECFINYLNNVKYKKTCFIKFLAYLIISILLIIYIIF